MVKETDSCYLKPEPVLGSLPRHPLTPQQFLSQGGLALSSLAQHAFLDLRGKCVWSHLLLSVTSITTTTPPVRGTISHPDLAAASGMVSLLPSWPSTNLPPGFTFRNENLIVSPLIKPFHGILAWAAITKYRRLSGLNNTFTSHNSGG